MVKIYVCHHPPLKHRKEKLEKVFSSRNIEVEWVEKFSPEEIVEDYDQIVGVKDIIINPNVPGVQQNQYTLYENAGRQVTIPELSLYLKHRYCFEEQIENGYDLIVILEDDIMLPNNIEEYLNKCKLEFIQSNPKLDVAVLGGAFNFKPNYIQSEKILHYGKNHLTRCTHAIMFSLDAAKKIISNLYPINWPIDFKYNEIIIAENLRVAWAEPSLQQETHLKIDTSSIQI